MGKSEKNFGVFGFAFTVGDFLAAGHSINTA